MDSGGCIGVFIVVVALVVLFGVPLAALVCIVGAWVYNLFH